MTASPLVTYGIGGMGVFCAAALVIGVWFAARPYTLRVALIAAAWLLLSARLARAGFLARFDAMPPPFAFLLLAMLGLAFTLGLSHLGTLLGRNIPLWALVGIQSFRLPLELIMHRAAEEGVMPVQMSYSGWNFDIVTGALALIVAALLLAGRAPRWLVAGWNALGWLTLICVVSVAITSTPMFRWFGTTPDKLNTWVAYHPFVWLPASCVLFALAGHIVITRRMQSDR